MRPIRNRHLMAGKGAAGSVGEASIGTAVTPFRSNEQLGDCARARGYIPTLSATWGSFRASYDV